MSGGKLMPTACGMVGDTAGHRIGAENGPGPFAGAARALMPVRRESGGLSNAEPKGEEFPQDNLLGAVPNSDSEKRE